MNGWNQLTNFLALRRNTTLLLAALVLAGMGERLWLGFAPKYLETLGAGVLIIGLFDAVQTLHTEKRVESFATSASTPAFSITSILV